MDKKKRNIIIISVVLGLCALALILGLSIGLTSRSRSKSSVKITLPKEVMSNTDLKNLKIGDEIELEVTVPKGKVLVSFLVNGEEKLASLEGNKLRLVVLENIKVKVQFKDAEEVLEKFKITFKTDSAEVKLDPIEVKKGESLNLPELPNPDYYVVSAYLDNDGFTKPITFPLIVNKDMVIGLVLEKYQYAKITIPEEVSANKDDLEKVKFYEKVELTVTPPEGKVLVGFRVNGKDELSKVINNKYELEVLKEEYLVEVEFIDKNRAVKITYKEIEEKIPDQVIYYEKGSTISSITLANIEFYLVEGYYEDSSKTTSLALPFEALEDKVIYVSLIDNYFVVTKIVDSKEVEKVRQVKNTKIINEYIEKPGYLFDGWYLDENFETPNNQKTPRNEDITVYGRYIKIHKVRFISNIPDRMPNKTYNMYENAELLSYLLEEVDGYPVLGYFYDSEYTLKVNPEDRVHKDLDIYVKFEDICVVKVIENLSFNKKLFKVSKNTKLKDLDLTDFKPDQAGAIFLGFYKDSQFLEPLDLEYEFTKGETIFAKYKGIAEIEIHILEYDKEKEDYTLIKHIKDYSQVGDILPIIAHFKVDSSKVVCKWKWHFPYEVGLDYHEFNPAGYEVSSSMEILGYIGNPALITYNSPFGELPFLADTINPIPELEGPGIEGKVFKGWYTDKNFETLYDFNIVPKNDLVLYARYDSIPVKVTFIYDELDSSKNLVVDGFYGESIQAPTKKPKKGNKAFYAWVYEEDRKKEYQEEDIFKEDTNLIPVFKEIFTVTYKKRIRNYFRDFL